MYVTPPDHITKALLGSLPSGQGRQGDRVEAVSKSKAIKSCADNVRPEYEPQAIAPYYSQSKINRGNYILIQPINVNNNAS